MNPNQDLFFNAFIRESKTLLNDLIFNAFIVDNYSVFMVLTMQRTGNAFLGGSLGRKIKFELIQTRSDHSIAHKWQFILNDILLSAINDFIK
jgi:hypothetical protein